MLAAVAKFNTKAAKLTDKLTSDFLIRGFLIFRGLNMGTKVILADREDIKNVTEEEKTIFIFTVLSQSLNEQVLSELLPDDGISLSVEQRIKLRQLCAKFDIKIIDDLDEGVDIFIQDRLIARWYKPWIVLRTNLKERDRTKRIHAEIQMKWWLISEENNDE